jgi:hypothetical protein
MPYGRAEAIQELQRDQAQVRNRLGLAPKDISEGVLVEALAAAERREKAATIEDGRVRSFAFSYPLALEQKRWTRTRDIIHRVAPGLNEDPAYLEMVARQAASVEMILRREHTDAPNARVSDLCDRVLIATMPSFSPSAVAVTVKDYFLVLLSAGLIDFVYQVAKVVVLSWKIARDESGRVSARGKPEDIDATIAANPRLTGHLMMTYANYIYKGVPRVGGLPPPMLHRVPLTMLTNFNERFILAHEYSHTLFDSIGFDAPDDLPRHGEELMADAMAFHLVAESGYVLDGVPPNMSLQGAFFVLSVLDTLRRALDIARHGEVGEDVGFASHPPLSQRYQYLVQRYKTEVSDEDGALSINAALIPSRSVMHLWSKIEEPLKAYRGIGMPLHGIWG